MWSTCIFAILVLFTKITSPVGGEILTSPDNFECFPNQTIQFTNPDSSLYTYFKAFYDDGSEQDCTVTTNTGKTLAYLDCASATVTVTLYISDRNLTSDDDILSKNSKTYTHKCDSVQNHNALPIVSATAATPNSVTPNTTVSSAATLVSVPVTPSSDPNTTVSAAATSVFVPVTPSSDPNTTVSAAATLVSVPVTLSSDPNTTVSAAATSVSVPVTPSSDPNTTVSAAATLVSVPVTPSSDPNTTVSAAATSDSVPVTPSSDPNTTVSAAAPGKQI